MSLDAETIEALARHLETCQLEARDTPKITDDQPQVDWGDAYAIQDAIRRRKTDRGERIVGLKAGLTSRAKMRQMGVESPIFGFLADSFAVPEGGTVDTSRLIHPKVEPEIAFVTKAPLRGPGCHIGHVLAATDFVVPAIEVIDSRYRDFKFDLRSVVADNCSSACFATGAQATRVDGLDLGTLGVVLEKNGQPVAFGAGAAVLGHPAQALVMMANEIGRRGQEIPAGSLVLSGGITQAIPVEAGDSVHLRVQSLGSVRINFS